MQSARIVIIRCASINFYLVHFIFAPETIGMISMTDPKYADCECEGCIDDKQYWFEQPCSRCTRKEFKKRFQLSMFQRDYYRPRKGFKPHSDKEKNGYFDHPERHRENCTCGRC